MAGGFGLQNPPAGRRRAHKFRGAAAKIANRKKALLTRENQGRLAPQMRGRFFGTGRVARIHPPTWDLARKSFVWIGLAVVQCAKIIKTKDLLLRSSRQRARSEEHTSE